MRCKRMANGSKGEGRAWKGDGDEEQGTTERGKRMTVSTEYGEERGMRACGG